MKMNSLSSWPIFRFLPEEQRTKIKKAIVFGPNGNEVLLVHKNDDVYAFGNNDCGCLGISAGNQLSTKLTKVEDLSGQSVKSIAYGSGPHLLAVTESGELHSWGHNRYCQLGHDEDMLDEPCRVYLKDKGKVTAVACGSHHSVALSKGNVYTWGLNTSGQLGLDKSNDSLPYPKCVTDLSTCVTGKKHITSIACGKEFTVALSDTGELFTWGNNADGQLGIDDYQKRITPVQVDQKYFENNPVHKVVCGTSHVLTVTVNGDLYSWGDNSYGQLGHYKCHVNVKIKKHEQFGAVSKPKQVLAIEEVWRDIIAHHYSNISVGLTESGRIFVWGHCRGMKIYCPQEVFCYDIQSAYADYANSTMTELMEINNDSGKPELALENAFNDKETSDFTVIVNGKKIYVHKSILKIKSEYFRNMLKSQWKESEKNELTVEFFSYSAYEAYLKYLYTDKIGVTDPCVAMELKQLADSFCEPQLVSLCEGVVKKGITVENASRLLEISSTTDAALYDFCFKFSINNLTAVVRTKAFVQSSGECVKNFFIKAGKNKAFKK